MARPKLYVVCFLLLLCCVCVCVCVCVQQLLFANMAEAVQLLFSSASLRVSLLITTKPTLTDTHSLQILTLKSLIQYINEGEASQKGALEENMCVTVETRAESEVEKGIEEVAHNARYDASTVNTTHARVYHRSNSWDGISQQCLVRFSLSLSLSLSLNAYSHT